jgi:hypothetical protein
MILWLLSVVIVGVLAAGPSIAKWEALILLGIAVLAVAIRLRRWNIPH